ncbi:hypothetical protein SNEBB_007748 [Seison nebaliae]|nr:hypothetical protein SNEBB_007748 [Seison nebaliae]
MNEMRKQMTRILTFEDKTIINVCELYVSNLSGNIIEDELLKLFNKYGKVDNIEIKVSSKGGKFALVRLSNDKDAENAINKLNFTVFFGNEIHISRSLTKFGRRSNEGNIIIRNLPPSLTSRELFVYLVNEFNNILSFKLVEKRYCYIRFLHKTDAEKFIAKYNEKSLNGHTLKVTPFIPKVERKSNDNHFTNIFIKNFGTYLDNESLREMFEKFGEIVSAVVMKDDVGCSKGFGFINFANWESAEKAIEEMNQSIVRVTLKSTIKNKKDEIEDRTIYVGKAVTKAEREAENCQKSNSLKFTNSTTTLSSNSSNDYSESEELIITNIDKHLSMNIIYNYLRKYGEIKSFNVKKYGKNNQKATVAFKCKNDLEKVMKQINFKIKANQFLSCAPVCLYRIERACPNKWVKISFDTNVTYESEEFEDYSIQNACTKYSQKQFMFMERYFSVIVKCPRRGYIVPSDYCIILGSAFNKRLCSDNPSKKDTKEELHVKTFTRTKATSFTLKDFTAEYIYISLAVIVVLILLVVLAGMVYLKKSKKWTLRSVSTVASRISLVTTSVTNLVSNKPLR